MAEIAEMANDVTVGHKVPEAGGGGDGQVGEAELGEDTKVEEGEGLEAEMAEDGTVGQEVPEAVGGEDGQVGEDA